MIHRKLAIFRYNGKSSLTVNNVNGKDAYACVKKSNDVYLQLHKLVQCVGLIPSSRLSTSLFSITSTTTVPSSTIQKQFSTTSTIFSSFLASTLTSTSISTTTSKQNQSQPLFETFKSY